MENKKLLVSGFFNKDSENPYCRLFYEALEMHGIDFIYGEAFNNEWILGRKKEFDWLHIHWPEGFWRYCHGKAGGVYRGLVGFWLLLRKAKTHGLSLAWTVHNLTHHEGVSAADQFGYKLLYKYCDLLICHSEFAKKEILQHWNPSGEIIVMPHGNYAGVYPDPDPRDVILEQLGLRRDLPVVSCIGLIRKYKGLDIAIEAAVKSAGKFQLLIAGKPHPDFNLEEIQAVVDQNAHIAIVPESLSEKEFSNMFNVTDVALLPYRNVTGSGALLTALTFGCGVVASDLPYFREVLGEHPEAGTLFNVGDSDALAQSIQNYLKIPGPERLRAARGLADHYAWDNVVEPVAERFKVLAKAKT